MRTVSLLEFRKNAQATLQKVAAGQSVVLTRRGQAIARLEPIAAEHIPADAPIYTLGELAVQGAPLTNQEMDREIYGS